MEATDRWQQVEDIFHAALERDPGKRAAFLNKACGSDALLREEVESLIDAHLAPGDFIDTPAYRITNSLFSGNLVESKEGRVVGHYSIVGHLGRGGMGEVYLAEDTQLGRKVALKFLPASVTGDASRLRRFEQEARAASALNHPNIVTIYEIGEAEGSHYIATELIEGDTLRRKLSRGKVEMRDAIEVTIQVGSALSAAHQSGIVHRDIKPENIMLRPDGYVKILDFGLAKLTQQREESSEEMARRIVRVDTEPGVVMGTLSYMSPEQARGREVDGRSDIFSLGVVLYEMIAEQAPFEGDTPSDVIASILKVEPTPLSRFSSDIPAEMQRIVNRALHKDKTKRYQSAEEMLADLKSLKQDMEFEAKLSRTGGFMSSFLIKSTRRGLTPYLALIGLVLIIVAGSFIWWFLIKGNNQPTTVQPTSLKTVPVADWKSSPGESTVTGSISPDGRFVAFSSSSEGTTNIWVKQIAGDDPYQVTKGDGNDSTPIWSPDGEQLAFASNRDGQNGIWTVPFFGNSAPRLVKSMDANLWPYLKRWSRDGNALYYQLGVNLYSVDLRSGEANQLTQSDMSTPSVYDFSISPDENRIAYIQNKDGQADVYVFSRQGGQIIQVTKDAEEDRNPVWLPDGERLIYSSYRDGVYQICLASIDGRKQEQVTVGESDLWISDVSADGSKILYTSSKEDCDIWGVSLADGEESEITSADGVEIWPDVSPDGNSILYQYIKEPSDGRRILQGTLIGKRLDGGSEKAVVVSNGFDPQWSPDGKQVAFLRASGNIRDLWVVKTVGGAEQQLTNGDVSMIPFSRLPYNRFHVKDYSWSPRGDRIAYTSIENNLSNIYEVDVNSSDKSMVSNNMDSDLSLSCPLWSPDGSLIAYSSSPSSPNKVRDFNIWITSQQNPLSIHKSSSLLQLLGWTPSGDGVLVSSVEKKRGISPTPDDVSLYCVFLDGKAEQLLGHLRSAYFYSIRISPDGKSIAYVSREDGKDNIYLFSLTGGRTRKITSNADQRLYFSGLTWSPDGKTLYYGRQTRRSLVSMFDNFK